MAGTVGVISFRHGRGDADLLYPRRRRASSNAAIRPSICLSVRLSVPSDLGAQATRAVRTADPPRDNLLCQQAGGVDGVESGQSAMTSSTLTGRQQASGVNDGTESGQSAMTSSTLTGRQQRQRRQLLYVVLPCVIAMIHRGQHRPAPRAARCRCDDPTSRRTTFASILAVISRDVRSTRFPGRNFCLGLDVETKR